MRRSISLAALLWLAADAPADSFDSYTNEVLAGAVRDGKLTPIEALTPELLAEHSDVLPDSPGAFLVVYTNDRRYAKVLARSGRVRVGEDAQVPMVLIDRFVTFREATERTVRASGENRHLFVGQRFHLDFGQTVPDAVGGDLVTVAEPDSPLSVVLEPLGEAKMYLLTEALAGLTPGAAGKPTVGQEFRPEFFEGTYQLRDDGRRAGELKLAVTPDGTVSGAFYSDKDGAKYDVEGKVGIPRHSVEFSIKFPRTVQTFKGWLFTGDAGAITGSSMLEGRETGFFATRK